MCILAQLLAPKGQEIDSTSNFCLTLLKTHCNSLFYMILCAFMVFSSGMIKYLFILTCSVALDQYLLSYLLWSWSCFRIHLCMQLSCSLEMHLILNDSVEIHLILNDVI